MPVHTRFLGKNQTQPFEVMLRIFTGLDSIFLFSEFAILVKNKSLFHKIVNGSSLFPVYAR